MIPEREASDLTDDLEDIWLKESKKSKPSLLRAIWASVSYRLRIKKTSHHCEITA